MTLTWRIIFPFDTKSWSDQEIADFIMPKFWLKQSEYRLTDKGIEGTPSTIAWIITPIRLSVYDITINPDRSSNMLIIRTRLYKLYFLLSPFIIVGILTTFHSAIEGLIIVAVPFIFFGVLSIIQLKFSLIDIKRKLKTLTNNA